MQTDHIVALLIAERDRLNRAIEALQGPTKRRGRPAKNTVYEPAGPTAIVAPAPATRKRTFTDAQRKAQAKRMKAYWAAKKKAK
jgi:hypothetical protein